MEESILMRVVVMERAKVLAFIRSLVRDREVAEDLFQDVCVLALEKRAAIRDEMHLKKWLRTAARMEASNLRRRSARRGTPLDDRFLDAIESVWDQRDSEDHALEAAALRECLEGLSPSARELVHQRYVENIGYAEIAETLNRSKNGLYVALCRIHVALADCVTKRLAM